MTNNTKENHIIKELVPFNKLMMRRTNKKQMGDKEKTNQMFFPHGQSAQRGKDLPCKPTTYAWFLSQNHEQFKRTEGRCHTTKICRFRGSLQKFPSPTCDVERNRQANLQNQWHFQTVSNQTQHFFPLQSRATNHRRRSDENWSCTSNIKATSVIF